MGGVNVFGGQGSSGFIWRVKLFFYIFIDNFDLQLTLIELNPSNLFELKMI
jgi:hypothetical protein